VNGKAGSTALNESARVLGGLTVAAGVSVLAGWALDLPWLRTIVPGTVSMKANTALGFVLAGASLAVAPRGRVSRRVVRTMALATSLLGLLTLAQFVLQVDLGIDQLLFREPPGGVGTLAPGRMAPTSAVAFVLVGGSRWLATTGRAVLAAQRLALVPGLLGYLSVASYVCGATDLHGMGRYTQMAANTAMLFLLVSAGLLLLHPSEGLMRPVTSRAPSGWLLRRMLPILFAVPLLIGWLGAKGTVVGHWTPQFAIALVVVLLVVVLTSVTYWAAQELGASETARRRAEEERAELQAQLARSARLAAMGTLVAGVAHEINNPLAAVMSSAGTIAEDVAALQAALRAGASPDPVRLARRVDEAGEMIGDVLTSAGRIARIVKDLSVFGRPDQKRTPIQLADAIRRSMEWLPDVVAERATIRAEISEVPPVIAAEHQIGQVLVNLVTNAALAIRDGRGGEIVIRLGPGEPGMARLEVSDDGEGIDPALLDRIFEPFFTTRPQGKGTGLGLSICNAIVNAHGGTLTAKSQVGRGSTFRVELPLA
jgi:signal transduction histidine kinase